MENNNFPYKKMRKDLFKQILVFFPFNIFQSLISKFPKERLISIMLDYYKFDSFEHMEEIALKVLNEHPDQIPYIKENIFLPFYSVSANGVYECGGDVERKTINNPLYANDQIFTPTSTFERLFLIAGIYYNVKAENYYSFLKNFKLPFESIKEDYINTNMQKLSKILKKNNFDFTDFDYYRFYRDSTLFDERTVRKKKLKFINIKNEIVKFFKNNPTYYTGCDIPFTKPTVDFFGKNRLFNHTKSKIKFILKSFKFCEICSNFKFDIYSLDKDFTCFQIEDIKEECFNKIKKVSNICSNDDKVEIIEYYDDKNSEINPVISIKTGAKKVEYLHYDLNKFRFGKYLVFTYPTEEMQNHLPTMFIYGALINT